MGTEGCCKRRECGEMVVMSCGESAEVVGILEEILGRLPRSIEKHGDWENYDESKVFEAVAGEFDEYREAVVIGRVDGPHGQVDELYDVVVTAIKGIRRLLR